MAEVSLPAGRAPRVAIFGGAFDPVHNAHLAVARTAAAQFHLDRVLFVPSYRPPHKGLATHAPFEDRVRMVELACADLNAADRRTRFEVSRVEERDAPSYSIDTIAKVRAQLAADDELFFIIGADAFAELRTWHKWRDVARAVRFIVVSRPGYSYDAPDEVKVEGAIELDEPASSSGIRRGLAAGEKALDAPRGVLEYIRSHGLYAAPQQASK